MRAMMKKSEKVFIHGEWVYLNAIVLPLDYTRGLNTTPSDGMLKADAIIRYMAKEGFIEEGDEVVICYKDFDVLNRFTPTRLNA